MKKEADFGEPTQTVAFLNMNWNVVDASDIYKLCEDVVGSENIKEVKIVKTKFGEKQRDIGKFKDEKEFKTGKLEIIKQSYAALVSFSTKETALKVYSELDSTELENSGMFFDLRFVDSNIKTGEIVEQVESGENFVEKDYNKFEMEESKEEKQRKILLEKLFNSKSTDRGLLNQLISVSDNEDDAIEDETLEVKKKMLFEGDKKEEKPVKKEDKPKDNAFVFDHLDPRFAQLYTDGDFTIDPTHPEYQKNNKLKNIINEKRKRFETED
ncbi:Pre-rRNA-processing protein esf1 [Nosema granulosis]|uniref:Pre-rRNA-processing protein esf1 n=1 Tax=Nosema granulosis TaxID=83296 RepID=A0A9P6KYB3_9MICR|nr:Pre-rRNA-processing protein esf1 [Nosema granulosis]